MMRNLFLVIAIIFCGKLYSQTPRGKAFIFKEITTAVKSAYVVPSNEVWLVYDTDLDTLQVNYNGAGWENFGVGTGGGSDDQTAAEVSWDNTTYGGSNTNVQTALEGLYEQFGEHEAGYELGYANYALSDVTLNVDYLNEVSSFTNAGKIVVRINCVSCSAGDYFDIQTIDEDGYFIILEPDGRYSPLKYGKTTAGTRARVIIEYNGSSWQYFNGVVVEYPQNEYYDASAANPVEEINSIGSSYVDTDLTISSISSDVNDGTYALEIERTALVNGTEYAYIPLGITDGDGDGFVVEVDYKVISGTGWQLQLSTSLGWAISDIDNVSSGTWTTNIFPENDIVGAFAMLRVNKTDADLGVIRIDKVRLVRQ
jgi:hypothetical protein